MKIVEYVINAEVGTRLFEDDVDRRAFCAAAKRVLGLTIIAYCLMDTHAHLVLEGATARMLKLVARLRAAHARAYRRRHGASLAWRGPTRVHELDDPATEVGTKVRYVHLNPVRAGLVEIAIEWPWSSARELVGLSLAGIANVARARALGVEGGGIPPYPAGGDPPQLGLLLAAAAQVWGIEEASITGGGHGAAALARRAFVQAAIVEKHSRKDIWRHLGVSESRVSQLAADPPEPGALDAVRALVRDLRLRRRLPLAAGALTS